MSNDEGSLDFLREPETTKPEITDRAEPSDWRLYECRNDHERQVLGPFVTLDARQRSFQDTIDQLKQLHSELMRQVRRISCS